MKAANNLICFLY